VMGVERLIKCGFNGSQVDPCFLIKYNSSALMAIYMDDCLTIGSDESIHEVFESLSGHGFGLKVENELTECLSYKIDVP
jgi:hypothetical protein